MEYVQYSTRKPIKETSRKKRREAKQQIKPRKTKNFQVIIIISISVQPPSFQYHCLSDLIAHVVGRNLALHQLMSRSRAKPHYPATRPHQQQQEALSLSMQPR